MLHVIVDGANVVGSRPDGWWRDRAGATQRLAGRLVAALREDSEGLGRTLGGGPITVHLVLEGRAALAEDLPAHPHLRVVRAPADGDTTVAALAAEFPGALVVTADRGLRDRVHAAGATTAGPSVLLAALG